MRVIIIIIICSVIIGILSNHDHTNSVPTTLCRNIDSSWSHNKQHIWPQIAVPKVMSLNVIAMVLFKSKPRSPKHTHTQSCHDFAVLINLFRRG